MNKNVKNLIDNNPDLAAFLTALEEENKLLKNEKEALQFTLNKLNRNIFGKKSEQSEHDKERNLFNLNEAEQNQN